MNDIVDISGNLLDPKASTSLRNRTFDGQKFRGLDLRRSDLTSAAFKNCEFHLTTVAGGNLDHAIFEDCAFDTCDFARTYLPETNFVECGFRKTSFHQCISAESYGEVVGFYGSAGTEFKRCTTYGFKEDGIETIQLDFTRSHLWLVTFDNCSLRRASFDFCTLIASDFTISDLYLSTFVGADVTGVDFSAATLNAPGAFGEDRMGLPTLGWDDFEPDKIRGHLRYCGVDFTGIFHESHGDGMVTQWPSGFVPPEPNPELWIPGRYEAGSIE